MDPQPPRGHDGWAPAILLALTATAVIFWIERPTLSRLDEAVPAGAFHAGHAWMFDHLARIAAGQRPPSMATELLAFPVGAELRPIALGPTLLAAPLRAHFGALGAYNLVTWLSPALSGLAAMALLRRLTGASRAVCAAAALPFALTPYALGCLASGQVAKLQLWALLLPLLAAASLIERPRPAAALALALSAALCTFTSPSLGLLLPFALGALALAGLRRGRWLGPPLSLALAAASMLPAWAFYGSSAARHAGDGQIWGTQPALRPLMDVDVTASIARLHGTLLPPSGFPRVDTDAVHLSYLPWPLLLGGLLALGLRARGWGMGLALTAIGATLAMGERLWWGDGPLLIGGSARWLPAHALDLLGYPLASSGMYYRAIVLAALGLSALLASAGGRLGGWRGLAFALLLGLGASAEGLRATAPLFPRPAHVVLSAALLQEMAQDPAPGAVLSLPLEHHGNGGQDMLQAAALHGRPTTAAPLVMRRQELPYLARLDRQLSEALTSEAPRDAVAKLGFRYVIWHELENDGGPSEALLTRALGPPDARGARARLWRLESPTP